MLFTQTRKDGVRMQGNLQPEPLEMLLVADSQNKTVIKQSSL